LEDIVERQIVADVPLCSLLSGGLDSSSVTFATGDLAWLKSRLARASLIRVICRAGFGAFRALQPADEGMRHDASTLLNRS
jgi:hypothetical protein